MGFCCALSLEFCEGRGIPKIGDAMRSYRAKRFAVRGQGQMPETILRFLARWPGASVIRNPGATCRARVVAVFPLVHVPSGKRPDR